MKRSFLDSFNNFATYFFPADIFPQNLAPQSKNLRLTTVTNIVNLINIMACYYSPALVIWISFSDYAPLYGFALHVLDVTSIHFALRVIIATVISITISILTSVGYLCAFFEVSGIVVLYFWSKILRNKEFSFSKTIQIYNQLKLMTILVQEIGHDLISVCLHHAYAVIISTIAMYYFVVQFTPGKQMSILVTYTSLLMLFGATGLEMLAICFVAKASFMSRATLRKLFMDHGKDKNRGKIVRSLQPNSISLEFLDSVDTIRNGIGMDYFVRYFERVQSHTINWLLATNLD